MGSRLFLDSPFLLKKNYVVTAYHILGSILYMSVIYLRHTFIFSIIFIEMCNISIKLSLVQFSSGSCISSVIYLFNV